MCDFSKQIESLLKEIKPDIICAETDESKFLNRVEIENVPRWIKLYSKSQKFKAKIHGKNIGNEFKIAINYANKHEISYQIIDMDIETILNETRKGPFNFFNNFLLHERNQFMANKLKDIAINHRNIVVIVGYIHLKGISEILKSMNITVKNIDLTKHDFKI